MVFFVSWQLWEQLTFVLAMGLVSVFAAGYVKLWWINRKVRLHELGDEEKRIRIQEMRSSGNILETPTEEPIPFGVRALEKGVEVEGIWISRNSEPLPEHLRIGRYVKRKSNASDLSVSSKNGSGSSLSIPSFQVPSGGRRVLSAFGLSRTSSPENASDDEIVDSARRAYQPKRSSALRYSSYNNVEFNPDALAHLEGDVQVHRPRGAGPKLGTGDRLSPVSLADNERSSGSFASSDSSLRHSPAVDTLRNSTYPLPGTYMPTQALHRGDYQAVHAPRTPSGPSVANPFATPDRTPSGSASSSQYMPTPSPYHNAIEPTAGDVELPLMQSHSREVSPERSGMPSQPGFPHANQTVRHINSGFSVLPAGTFATAESSKGKEVERPSTGDSQISQTSTTSQPSSQPSPSKRKPNKLQKKNRYSTGPRRSEDHR